MKKGALVLSVITYLFITSCTLFTGPSSTNPVTTALYPANYYRASPHTNGDYGWTNSYWSGYRGVPDYELNSEIW